MMMIVICKHILFYKPKGSKSLPRQARDELFAPLLRSSNPHYARHNSGLSALQKNKIILLSMGTLFISGSLSLIFWIENVVECQFQYSYAKFSSDEIKALKPLFQSLSSCPFKAVLRKIIFCQTNAKIIVFKLQNGFLSSLMINHSKGFSSPVFVEKLLVI